MITVALGKIAPAIPADVQFSPEELVWQLTLDQIESNTGRIIDPVTALASLAGSSTYCFDEQNVLYSKLRPYLNKVICPDKPGIATTELVPLRPEPERLDRQYLCYYLRSPKFLSWVSNQVAGAKMPRVSMQAFWAHEVPLPPLPEQRRIAAILDKADAIRRKRAEALRLAEDFLKSAFLDMFGDPMTNPKGWPMHRLGNHLTFVTSGSRGWAKYYASTGARFIRSLDVQMNHISDSDAVFVNPPDSAETRRTLVCPNDVLLTITGSRIGRVAPVNSSVGEAYISQHVAILRLNNSLRSPFLSMFLSEARGGQHQIQRMQYGQTKPGLNLEQLRAFEIPYPPLSMQDQFCSIWNKFDVHTQHHGTAKQQTEDLFNSLVQHAFCGEL